LTITQETEQASIPIVNVDEEGFLVQPEIWTKEVAQFLARDEVEGELTEEHWKVIDYFRKYYLEFKSVPPVRKLARDTGCDLKRACTLFPESYFSRRWWWCDQSHMLNLVQAVLINSGIINNCMISKIDIKIGGKP